MAANGDGESKAEAAVVAVAAPSEGKGQELTVKDVQSLSQVSHSVQSLYIPGMGSGSRQNGAWHVPVDVSSHTRQFPQHSLVDLGRSPVTWQHYIACSARMSPRKTPCIECLRMKSLFLVAMPCAC